MKFDKIHNEHVCDNSTQILRLFLVETGRDGGRKEERGSCERGEERGGEESYRVFVKSTRLLLASRNILTDSRGHICHRVLLLREQNTDLRPHYCGYLVKAPMAVDELVCSCNPQALDGSGDIVAAHQ